MKKNYYIIKIRSRLQDKIKVLSNKREFIVDKLGTFNFNLLRSNFVATTSNMIFKRDVFDTIGGFAELRYAHDWDFLLRVCLHDFRCSVYPEALVNYRSHNSNTISSHMDDMNLDIAIILEVYIRLFYSKNLFRKGF